MTATLASSKVKSASDMPWRIKVPGRLDSVTGCRQCQESHALEQALSVAEVTIEGIDCKRLSNASTASHSVCQHFVTTGPIQHIIVPSTDGNDV